MSYVVNMSAGKQAYLQRIAAQAAEYANEMAVVYGDDRARELGWRWLQDHVRPGLELMVCMDMYSDELRQWESDDADVGGAA